MKGKIRNMIYLYEMRRCFKGVFETSISRDSKNLKKKKNLVRFILFLKIFKQSQKHFFFPNLCELFVKCTSIEVIVLFFFFLNDTNYNSMA